jgi:serine palmitoyltransferase
MHDPILNVPKRPYVDHGPKKLAWYWAFSLYMAFAIAILLGYIKEYFGTFVLGTQFQVTPKGYAPLIRAFDSFYYRRMYSLIRDCWNRPIASAASAWIDVMTPKPEGGYTTKRCLNLGSYNYLGFADGSCNDEVIQTIKKYGVSSCSTRIEGGYTELHKQLEKTISTFVGKEDAIVFDMGYATNSTVIPALIGKGGLIISDSLNHASVIAGCKSSGAKVRVFQHNDVENLEQVLREAIVQGQPRTHRPWTKILIVVEGIYSMEGEICRLPEIVEVKKKYKAYLYVDEAHSIGSIGHTGRGVSEYFGVPPSDIDILMGTFTKSFGSVGGYIASNKELIAYLRSTAYGAIYETSMSPACCQQIISALNFIQTDEGANRLFQLRENTIYFRKRMAALGFPIFGNPDSPVAPMALYHAAKMPAFSRECLERNIACVAVGYPATPLLLPRVRFCLSSAHTRKDLDWAIEQMSEIGDIIELKYFKPKPFDKEEFDQQIQKEREKYFARTTMAQKQ